jgi:hypothetical protein
MLRAGSALIVWQVEMKSVVMLEHLQAAAEQLGVKVSYESLQTAVTGAMRGGLCRVRSTGGMVWRCIVDKRASDEERVATLANALGRFDIATLNIHDKVREMIEQYARPV